MSARSILKAIENTDYFNITHASTRPKPNLIALLAAGEVLFAVEIPRGFRARTAARRSPALLVAADATDPVATSAALGALNNRADRRAPQRPAPSPSSGAPPFEIRVHARYNPAGSSQLNIVPGLMGMILTLTMVIFTALSVTREIERGTMENLLSMPITPLEIMPGKIVPYVLIGFLQAALILGAGVVLFDVPIFGNLFLLALLSTLVHRANLAVGHTFSTLAQNQLQAMQMAFFFFLPTMLLSGFMFPFLGMPVWAQWFGESLPLTHFIRIVRAIMLKGATLSICITIRWRWQA